MDACVAQGVEASTWYSDGGFVTITFKRLFFNANTIETNREDDRTSTPLSTPQVEMLIKKMAYSCMTMRKMAEVCDIIGLKYFRESYITPASEDGIIERLYPNHPK